MSGFSHDFRLLCAILPLFAIVALGSVDIKVNGDIDTSVQNEPSITINHHYSGDPLNVVAAYNDIGTTLGISYSADSGKTWTDTQLPYQYAITGDPSLASDNNGNVYACFLSYEGTWFYGKSGIFVCKSTDGGRNWSSPVPADTLIYHGGLPVKFADKCFMTVDTNSTSSNVGNIYVGWQRDDTNGSNSDIFFARSTDGGLNFSAPIQINDNPPQTSWAEGAFPFVGAGGDVYMTWYDAYFKGHVPGSLYVDISYDGGQTFGTDTKVANFLAPPKYTSACSGFKVKSFPSAAADPNDPAKLYITYISDPDGYSDIRVDGGDNDGQAPSDRPVIERNASNVYIAWEEFRTGPNADIYFNRSTDNGQTWEIQAIGPLDNTDTPGLNNSWFARLSSSGNNVYCVWTDYRSGTSGVWFNYSLDNGLTWKTEQKLDGTPPIPSYSAEIASTGSWVYVTWADYRNGLADIYFSRSSDNGVTWSSPIRIDLGDAAGATVSQPALIACQGNYVYCAWIDLRGNGTGEPYFNYSTDNGATWQSSSISLAGGLASGTQQLRLAQTGNNVYTCWVDSRTGIYNVYFNNSTNNGVTWGTNVVISDPGFTCWWPDLDCQGSYVYIGWSDNRMTGIPLQYDDIFFDYSPDNGVTWQSPDIGPLDAAPGLPSTALDLESDGTNVYATWFDHRSGPGEIYFNRSTNNGAAWGADLHVNLGTQPSSLLAPMFPSMVAGNGWVNIVWPDPRCLGPTDIYTNYSSDSGATFLYGPDEADVFCIRSTNGGLSWDTPVRVNDGTMSYADVLPWVVVTSNGLVDISYYHFRPYQTHLGGQVQLAVSADAAQSFNPSFIIQDTVIPAFTQWVGEYNGMAVLDSLVYTVFTDFEQTGNSDIFLDISLNPAVNQPPTLDPIGAQNVDEGQSLAFGVSASDPEGAHPTLTTSSLPPNASFSDIGNGTGNFSFSPDFSQSGVHNVTFYATDDSAAVDSEVVPITVNNTNRAPVLDATNDTTIAEGETLVATVSATDPDGTTPALSAEDVPSNGGFVDNSNGTGTFTFSPDVGQAGSYPVRFIADDGSLTDTLVVTITVEEAGAIPIVALDSIDGDLDGDSAKIGAVLTFYVHAENPTGDNIDSLRNGFQVYSSDGASWTTLTGWFADTVLNRYEGAAVSYTSVTGADADSVGFTADVDTATGLLAGYSWTTFMVQVGPMSGPVGSHVCLDSSFCPPATDWTWYAGGSGLAPTWDGPHCLRMVACCVGLTGNVDNDPAELIDLGDLTALIDYLFISFTPPACMEEANVDGDPGGFIDLGDLTALIDYLFISFTPPAACP
jgi:hypothetical protein